MSAKQQRKKSTVLNRGAQPSREERFWPSRQVRSDVRTGFRFWLLLYQELSVFHSWTRHEKEEVSEPLTYELLGGPFSLSNLN